MQILPIVVILVWHRAVLHVAWHLRQNWNYSFHPEDVRSIFLRNVISTYSNTRCHDSDHNLNNLCVKNQQTAIRRSWFLFFPFCEESVPESISFLFCAIFLCEWYYKGKGWKWGRKEKDIKELRWDGRQREPAVAISVIFSYMCCMFLRARLITCIQTEVA